MGGASLCLYHNSLTAGGSHHVMFLSDELLFLLPSTGFASPPSTSSCVLKEMEILFTQSTNAHICSLMLNFVDMRRLVSRLVSSDCLQEDVKKEKKVSQQKNKALAFKRCVSVCRSGGRPPTVVCACACNQGLIDL